MLQKAFPHHDAATIIFHCGDVKCTLMSLLDHYIKPELNTLISDRIVTKCEKVQSL